MARADNERIVQVVLGRYRHSVGRAVVGDDTCLARLLANFKLDLEDRKVSDYLCSFLVA